MYDSMHCKRYVDYKLINLNVILVTPIINKFIFG